MFRIHVIFIHVILSEAWRSRNERHAQPKDPFGRHESAKRTRTQAKAR